jgi:hypothetical protein
LSESFDTRKFLRRWKEKDERLFTLGVVAAGLEREGNLDAAARREISEALKELDLSEEELRAYLKKNHGELLRFLDCGESSP